MADSNYHPQLVTASMMMILLCTSTSIQHCTAAHLLESDRKIGRSYFSLHEKQHLMGKIVIRASDGMEGPSGSNCCCCG